MQTKRTAVVLAAASLLLAAGYALPASAADTGQSLTTTPGNAGDQIEPGTGSVPMGPTMMGEGQMGTGQMGTGSMPGGKHGSAMMGGTISPSRMGTWMNGGAMGQGMTGPGVGTGMMGLGWGYIMPSLDLNVDDVRSGLERYLKAWGNPHVKLGKVTDSGHDTITAEIVTQDNSLVERIEVNKETGLFHMVP